MKVNHTDVRFKSPDGSKEIKISVDNSGDLKFRDNNDAEIVKLKETKDLIQPINKKINVHDDNVTNLLNYYELINELKTIHG